MKFVHFETLGCKLNQVESEAAARAFVDAGFAVSMDAWTAATKIKNIPEICIVNTCTVTAKAEQKARRIIRLLLSKCPETVVVVTGCYAQLDSDFIRAIDERVAVLGGQHKDKLADIPQTLLKTDKQGKKLASILQKIFDDKDSNLSQKNLLNSSIKKIEQKKIIIAPAFRLSTDTFLNHSRSSIKIEDGCNNSCTYCRIHLARGKAVSLDAQSVLDRVKSLEDAGQNEVVFTTVNIAQYRGAWKDGFVNFAGLLKILLENTTHISFRISSLYPEIVDDELCSLIASPRVRPHFHLSVQSGSDRILTLMKRPYKSDVVRKAVELLGKAKVNPFFACDIIAGFPGETDEDFNLTMNLMRDCNFTWIHAFPFSARPGTIAYSMRPMVPNSVAGERVAELEKFAHQSREKYINSFSGKTISAICETVHRPKLFKDKIIVHAVTENFLHCQIIFSSNDTNIPKAGSEIYVRIKKAIAQNEYAGVCDTEADYAGLLR